jgi:hypothetical protein
VPAGSRSLHLLASTKRWKERRLWIEEQTIRFLFLCENVLQKAAAGEGSMGDQGLGSKGAQEEPAESLAMPH